MKRLILTNINELVTCKGNAPKCGAEMKDAGIVSDNCIVIENGRIIKIGKTVQILKEYDICNCNAIDCKDKAVLPGFVDSHTHFIFGGHRQKEFAQRLSGATYMSILENGGGIASSVNATRQTSLNNLTDIGRKRADELISFGVTTVECKSGYGLDCDTEIKQLKANRQVNNSHSIDVVSTFLGAHSVPKEYKGREVEFLDFLINKVLPIIKKEEFAEFVDIFCEKGVFDIEQSRYYLSKAKEMGFKLKLHADEIVSLGGAELAAELNATSADHLLAVSKEGIKQMAKKGVIATLLPMTAFCLQEDYADARAIIDSGCAVALATDFNPGSCFTNSIPLLIALAALYMKMSVQEIVTALTINGACALGKQDEIGSIEVGKKADIVVLKYQSIDFLAYNSGVNIVDTVIKNGEVVKIN